MAAAVWHRWCGSTRRGTHSRVDGTGEQPVSNPVPFAEPGRPLFLKSPTGAPSIPLDGVLSPAEKGGMTSLLVRPDRHALPQPPLDRLAAEARACRVCAEHLPLGPRPVFRVSTTARLLIVGQAPGTKVHETGTPWNDPSGDRLRLWLQLDRDAFYDTADVAIVPMGLCYPGRLPRGGDAPPRKECAPLWRDPLAAAMPRIRLTLLVGSYAQVHTLGPGAMTERVRGFRDYLPRYFPLPHPSWRTGAWERRNGWFAAEVLPALRQAVHNALDS